MDNTICRRCGEKVIFENVSAGYFCYCPAHDEDLFEFETETTNKERENKMEIKKGDIMNTIQKRRDYMQIAGKEYTRKEIDNAVHTIQWDPFRRENLPFCQGEALKAVIRECNIPLSKISRMSLHGVIKESHGFYALDVQYKNARVELYIADNGCSTCVCCADVYEV